MIADHPSFKAAILPEDTDYRSVISVSYEGTIELHPDALDCLKEYERGIVPLAYKALSNEALHYSQR